MPKQTHRIIQICPPATSLFAVYSEAGDGKAPSSAQHLHLVPCPVVGLVEEGDGTVAVHGLVIEDWGLDKPAASNFLGYASSKEDAESQYHSD